jgi:hypothetical protein
MIQLTSNEAVKQAVIAEESMPLIGLKNELDNNQHITKAVV